MKKNSGFSIVELMITMAIAVGAITLSAPSFMGVLKESHLTSQLNVMVGTFNLARAEAVKRSAPIVVCPSIDATTCSGLGKWEDGWLVYVDADNTGTITGGDEVIRVYDALDSSVTARGETIVSDIVSFTPTGFGIQSGIIVFCDGANLGSSSGGF